MEASFYELSLYVAPGHVMTPRPATETLVDAALAHVGNRAARIADVGTGSGAIAVALAVRAPQVEIWATDLCEAAAVLSRRNAERHGVSGRVHVVVGDLLGPVPGPLDLIVANLPYLPERLRDERPEYSGEPVQAIFAPGDGLGPYRRLLASAESRLVPGGAVVIQLHGRALVAGRDELHRLSLAAA